jgi:hypothetical protein
MVDPKPSLDLKVDMSKLAKKSFKDIVKWTLERRGKDVEMGGVGNG